MTDTKMIDVDSMELPESVIETIIAYCRDKFNVSDPSATFLADVYAGMRKQQDSGGTLFNRPTSRGRRFRRRRHKSYRGAIAANANLTDNKAEMSRSGVLVLRWEAGINDSMSGALSPSQKPRADLLEDDATICIADFMEAVRAMPFRLVNKRELSQMEIFDSSNSLDAIPDNSMTTYWGVLLALEDLQRQNDQSDFNLLAAIARRSGYCPHGRPNAMGYDAFGNKKVVYAEDLFPYVRADSLDFDKLYWRQVAQQGEIWDQIDVPEFFHSEYRGQR